MKLTQFIIVLIGLVVIMMGVVAVSYIIMDDDPCPDNTILRAGKCCNDYNDDGYCDTSAQHAFPTGYSVEIEQQPSAEQVMLAKLEAALKEVENKNARQADGYVCDEYGCYKPTALSTNNDDYYNYYNYYTDRYYDHDNEISYDEWDLTIIVEDSETGDAIEDARVKIENGDDDIDYTDDEGEAKFRDIEEDCYDIYVSADGYESGTDDICIARDRKITIELDPENNNYELLVVVMDSETGEPIADARAYLSDGDTYSATTDYDGEAEFSGLDEDTYELTVYKSGYVEASSSIMVDGNKIEFIRLLLNDANE